jgi:hypothetical protein
MKLLAASTHHCNEMGNYDIPPVEEQGIQPLEEAERHLHLIISQLNNL